MCIRASGKGAAALTLAGDIGKGVAAVLLAKWFFSAHLNDAIYYRGAIIGVYLAAFFAVIGHVYPLYFGFKGGKAVSVATGTIAALEPVLLVPLVVIFFVTLACGKMVSLASVLCAAAYPLVTFCYQQFFVHAPAAQTGAASVARLWWACLSSGCTAATSRASARVRNTNFFRKKSDARPAFSFCLVAVSYTHLRPLR